MIMDGNFCEYDGNIFSPHMHYDAFAKRFSGHFEKVTIVARAFPHSQQNGQLVAKKNVQFEKLPTFRGVIKLLTKLPVLAFSIWNAAKNSDILLLRLPGNTSIIALIFCIIMGKRFSIEIVAEPRDIYLPSPIRQPIRFIAKFVHTYFTRLAVKKAQTVRYVTSTFLQTCYPADITKSFGFSDVYLPSRPVVSLEHKNCDELIIINVAMMHNISKGHHTLLDALEIIKNRNIKFTCHLVGDGVLRTKLKADAEERGISENIQFHGFSTSVWKILSTGNVFVLPSYQEGLPRSILEAMQLGLPCLSTYVGGIPEILPKEALFKAGDSYQLADKLTRIFQDKDFYLKLSSFSLEKSLEFTPSSIQKKYDSYLYILKETS